MWRHPARGVPWQILVKQSKMADVTTGGLFMPADSTEKPSEGLVVLAGPGTTHPETGKKCLYGLNGSTCAIVKKGSAVTEVSLRKQHRPLFCDAI